MAFPFLHVEAIGISSMLGPLEAMAASMAGAISATVFRRWAGQRPTTLK
jgi:hypothetical protein